MAKGYICDKCKKFFPATKEFMDIGTKEGDLILTKLRKVDPSSVIFNGLPSSGDKKWVRQDLCPSCYTKLVIWLSDSNYDITMTHADNTSCFKAAYPHDCIGCVNAYDHRPLNELDRYCKRYKNAPKNTEKCYAKENKNETDN